MKWLGGRVNPLSIDSGSKEQIDKSLGELWQELMSCGNKTVTIK